MSEQPKIIAIEGSSFTGKTALCTKISETYQWPYVPEYYHFANKTFPPYPPITTQAAIDNVEYFVDIEQKRKIYLNEILGTSRKAVVDRTFLSICGFQYLVQRFGGGISSVLAYAKERMQEMEAQDTMIKPDQLIVLTVDRELFNIRIKTRGRVGVDILNTFENISVYASFVENNHRQNGHSTTRVDQTGKLIESQIQSIIDSLND